jgi:DNA-directed RNA polymerase subunit beta'
MLASNNVLSPATGRPIITPSQDMVLGCYYLTAENPYQQKGAGKYFRSMEDAMMAFEQGLVDLHAEVWLRFDGPIEGDSEPKLVERNRRGRGRGDAGVRRSARPR